MQHSVFYYMSSVWGQWLVFNFSIVALCQQSIKFNFVALLYVVWPTMVHCCMWCGPLCCTAACGLAHHVALLYVVWPTMAHQWCGPPVVMLARVTSRGST